MLQQGENESKKKRVKAKCASEREINEKGERGKEKQVTGKNEEKRMGER